MRAGFVLAPTLSAPVLDTACVAGLQSLELELGLLLQSLENRRERLRRLRGGAPAGSLRSPVRES
jgi:hypothetical protein